MSTTTETPPPLKTVPSEIRARALGDRLMPKPEPTEEEKLKQQKEEEEKKKQADEAAAAENATKVAAETEKQAKAKKAKAGPKLPEPAAPVFGQADIDEAVRKALPSRTEVAAPKLTPEAQREVDLARFAERTGGEKYAGFADKVTTFYVEQEQHVANKAKELGGSNSPEFRDYLASDEFKDWVGQVQPRFERGDKGKFQDGLVAARARAEAEAAIAPKIAEVERKQLEMQHAPTIQNKTQFMLENSILIDARPAEEKDPAIEGFRAAPLKFGEDHPEEAQIIAAEAQQTMGLIQEVYRVDLGISAVNPRSNPAQQRIHDFMQRQNEAMRTHNPTGLQMSDGKILIDPTTYEQKQLNRDARYRTWTADEIAGMIAAEGNAKIIQKLTRRREGVAKSVYARPAPKPLAEPAKPKPAEDDASPMAGAGVMPNGRGKPTEKQSLGQRYA